METPLHRKLLLPLSESEATESYITLSPPSPSPVAATNHAVPYLVSATCALGVAFLVLTTCTILLRNRCRRRRVSASSPSLVNGGSASPVDHPIWHIVTIGLPQSVIDSIASVKYKISDGGAIDCSVCLTEFEDGDDVRVLPKCSHAFHLPCIDTWLRSHKNCPICRSFVVANEPSNDPNLSPGIENTHDSGSDSDPGDDEFETLPLQGAGMMDWKSDQKRVLGSESSSSGNNVHSDVLNGEGSSQMIEEADADKEGEGSGISRLIKTSSSSIGRSSARILSSFRGSKSHSSLTFPSSYS